MSLGPVGTQMEQKLREAFSPIELKLIDESHHHAGHSGTHAQGESHYAVKIIADAFAGQSLVKRHRMINEVLAQELKGRVHALRITAKAP